MSDLLGVGASALQSIQQALATTGHNIANVGTEGFHRQTVDFSTRAPQLYGNEFIGSGVQVDSVDRVQDLFVQGEIFNLSSNQSQQQIYHDLSARVDQLLAGSGGSLTTSLQQLFATVQEVANSPSALPERTVMLGATESLALRQQSLYQSLSTLGEDVNNRLQVAVNEINAMASSIGKLNNSISNSLIGGQVPNDLLDQRDLLIEQLSQKVGISTLEQSDGSINIFIGNGFGLVVGSEVRQLQTIPNEFDASRLDITIAGDTRANNTLARGGELQGLLDFRSRALDGALNTLSLFSLGLAETMNNQHALGIDLDGNTGADLFSLAPINAVASINNTGSGAPLVQLVDVDQLRDSNYSLSFDAGAWQLTRESDGVSVSGTGILSMDGMDVDVSGGSPASGDRFLIRPAASAAAGFGAALSDPRGIAAASPLAASNTLSNTGSAQLTELSVSDSSALPLSGPIVLTFDPNAMGPGLPGFNVSGAISTSVAYDPATDAAGSSFSLGIAGLNFTLSGAPDTGDTLVLDNTGASSGDNRNALTLADLQFDKTLQGGNSSFSDVYSGMVARVAVGTQQAATTLEVETSLLSQAHQYRDSVSGVNLDEEAATLLRLQQQYQAAAQLFSVADSLFQTLLGATRR